MNDRTQAGCPRTEAISALIDGELDIPASQELRLHAAQCAACGSALLAFTGMRADLWALREIRSDVDIAALVLPQLPKPTAPRRKPARSLDYLSAVQGRRHGTAQGCPRRRAVGACDEPTDRRGGQPVFGAKALVCFVLDSTYVLRRCFDPTSVPPR